MSKCFEFCMGLKFKADFHSKMSVCRHELGLNPRLASNPPGNSNTGLGFPNFQNYINNPELFSNKEHEIYKLEVAIIITIWEKFKFMIYVLSATANDN